jgi:hypothetical protein
MTIEWVEFTPTVWVADVHHYRGVISQLSDTQAGWVAHVEDGDVIHTATIIFQTFEGAEHWAALKLLTLAGHN